MKNKNTFWRLAISLKENEAGIRAANEKKYDWQGLTSQGKLNATEIPKIEPVFSGLILSKRSLESDFIENSGAIGGKGFIVSDKVKEIFKDFKLPIHKYYPLKLLSNPDELIINEDKYYWLQIIIEDYSSWLNLEESKLFLTNNETEETKLIDLTSNEEFKELLQTYNTEFDEELSFQKIVLNEEYLKKEYDLYYLDDFSFKAIVSTRLMTRLKKDGITGLAPFKSLNIELK